MNTFFDKFSLISKDMETFTVSPIVGRVKRSLLEFIPYAFRAKFVHNLVGHSISHRKRFSTFHQEADQLSFILEYDII